ncbi:MAG: PAT family beta-lactamase induction signal transducer AmpG [Flavobacteriales bacterium]|jgi:PAT family beta-lactamase induction signal transducer AmpG
MTQQTLSWLEALKVYKRKSVIVMFFLGFSAGLPYLLIFSTLTAWLRDEGVTRTAIGFFGWIGITYSIKLFWAPVLDSLKVPVLDGLLGHRRSWLLVAQLGVALSLLGMSSLTPTTQMGLLIVCAFGVAFSSATQDIVIDAFRIESDKDDVQAALAASYFLAYRLALLFSGAAALYFADIWSWRISYLIMAAAMGVGLVTTLVISEPKYAVLSKLDADPFSWSGAYDAFIKPFWDFFERNGTMALGLLFFVAFYRISDITMGIMANPFYLDLGFTKTEIASVSKVFGFFMTIFGSFIGGLFVVKYGIHRPLIFGAVSVALTNFLFAYLSHLGPVIEGLAMTITADNFCGGFAGAVFLAYLASLTNRAYSASQYALFSSLMTLPGKVISGFSGVVVDSQGYSVFFIYAALMGLPAIILSYWIYLRERS